MPATSHQTEDHTSGIIDVVTRWGLVVLAVIAALGALLRMFGPATTIGTQRLDQTTLLYLAVAGGLLLLKQIKVFSLGQLKLEMIEEIRERQDRQEERLADIALILPLLLPANEVKHVKNLAARATGGYQGNHSVRTELRRLASIGLLSRKVGRSIGDLKDGLEFNLGDYVELTDLGKGWAARIQEIEAVGDKDAPQTGRLETKALQPNP